MLTIPDVTTMTRDSAQQKLHSEGFTVTIRQTEAVEQQ